MWVTPRPKKYATQKYHYCPWSHGTAFKKKTKVLIRRGHHLLGRFSFEGGLAKKQSKWIWKNEIQFAKEHEKLKIGKSAKDVKSWLIPAPTLGRLLRSSENIIALNVAGQNNIPEWSKKNLEGLYNLTASVFAAIKLVPQYPLITKQQNPQSAYEFLTLKTLALLSKTPKRTGPIQQERDFVTKFPHHKRQFQRKKRLGKENNSPKT